MLVFLSVPVHASASDDLSIRIYVDGKRLETVRGAILVENTPYIPASFLRQDLGASVQWDSGKNTLTLERSGSKAQFILYERNAVIEGKAVKIDYPPIVLSNEIYVPAVSAGEALKIKVTWDIVSRSLQFYFPQGNATLPDTRAPADVSDPAGQLPQPPNGTVPGLRGDDVSSASPDRTSGDAVIHSIAVSGDQIIIGADRAIHATAFELSDPDRLVIDIPNSKIGSTLNGQPSGLNGTISVSHPNIQKIRYALFNNNPSTVRVVVDLSYAAPYTVGHGDDPASLIVSIPSERFKVVLDAGHGGKDPGANTYSKRYEKEFTLSLTLKVYELLKKEPMIEPVLTRSDDTFLELDERSEIANNIGADLFLSIHGNTYSSASVSGTETYYYNAASKSFAQTIHKHVVNDTGFRDRNVRQQEYKVLRLAKMPAALIEVGYLTNPDQEKLLFDEDFQNKIAHAIVNAIKEYLKL